MPRTAAALVIGNEILTGKIEEANVAFLAKELFALGVSLRRVVVCPDEVDVIVRDLDALRTAHDVVFTSGGVGPTHDDVTLEAVAKALGRRIVRSAEIEAMIRSYFGERTTEGHLRMADVPEGASLVRTGAMPWPTVEIENIYVFPGVPEVFRAKLPVLRDRLRADAPFHSRALYTTSDEFDIAAPLADVARAHPTVTIGSYLRWRETNYKVKLTFDGSDAAEVDRAFEAMRAAIAPDALVRVE
jgi:molybdenum cofactor synthesis domain-containing protein